MYLNINSNFYIYLIIPLLVRHVTLLLRQDTLADPL